MSVSLCNLLEGVDGLHLKDDRFNTTLITFNFYLPIAKQTVAETALLPFVLSSCCEEYKSTVLLNRRLCELYGARLSASVSKVKDFLHLRFCIGSINNEFAPNGENVVVESAKLLASLIFAPSFENGEFLQKDLDREKRKAIERIKGEINNKRIYARRRLLAEMFKDHPYGISHRGEIEDVEKVTTKSLTYAWQRMLRNSYVRVIVSSKDDCSEIFERTKNAFSVIKRENVTDIRQTIPFTPPEFKSITEHMDIVQGKIAMGFTSTLKGDAKTAFPLNVMCDLLGGGTYSKFFKNVREKLSLCYYCSATAARHIGFMVVESGVQADKKEQLKTQVLKELEAMQKGEFTDEDVSFSKLSLIETLKSYSDSQSALDGWYAARLTEDDFISPSDLAHIINGVTREQIISAANAVSLCTVYELMPKGEK